MEVFTVEILTLYNCQRSSGFKNVSISLVCVIFMTQKLRQSHKEVRKQWLLVVLLICSRYNLVTCQHSKQKRTGKNSRSTFPWKEQRSTFKCLKTNHEKTYTNHKTINLCCVHWDRKEKNRWKKRQGVGFPDQDPEFKTTGWL